MPFKREILRFVFDSSGAVSVDWVVLCGGIVGIGIIMLQAVGPAATGLADDARDRYKTARIVVAD